MQSDYKQWMNYKQFDSRYGKKDSVNSVVNLTENSAKYCFLARNQTSVYTQR